MPTAPMFFLLVLLAAAIVVPGGAVGAWAQDHDEAYADLSNVLGTTEGFVLRGRVVEEDDPVDLDRARPAREIAQDELKRLPVQLRLVPASGEPLDLGGATTDSEGYLEAPVTLKGHKVASGEHRVEVLLGGRVIGSCRVYLLASDWEGVVVRSDVDLTWLDTDFHSKRAKALLMAGTAADRRTLPGMEAVYRGLTGEGAARRPITFLSGSPRFFKRTLEAKLRADRIEQDGLHLKPFKELVRARLGALAPRDVIPTLEEQVGFKLATLLRLRRELPPGARELLLGDDSEADAVVYALYHRALSGELDAAALRAELVRLKVTGLWVEQILADLPAARANTADHSPVIAIFINRTARPNAGLPLAIWAIPELTWGHAGAWPLALGLYARGFLSREGARAVRGRLLKLGMDAEVLKQGEREAEAEGLIGAEGLKGLNE